MKIVFIGDEKKDFWNEFVASHYPPIGGFMQTWEWGEFQKLLGRKVWRFAVYENGGAAGIFTLVEQSLPLGFSYGYMPRGPLFSPEAARGGNIGEILNFIKKWALQEFPHFIFVRLEPPLSSDSGINHKDFCFPSYYVQPRYNLAIPLDIPENEIPLIFHPSTRSNLNRAERRGVGIIMKNEMTPEDYDEFVSMMGDTTLRNSGKNTYPGHFYFKSLFGAVPPAGDRGNPRTLSLAVFCGYQHDMPAAMHLVLFFGDTATYLYGASKTRHLSSKVTTYLHWEAMRESKRRGYKYYDLGGIDSARWPTLTNFKRQFRGKEFSYIGNIDILQNPIIYRLYNFLRGFRKIG